jgi:hypothetical protein
MSLKNYGEAIEYFDAVIRETTGLLPEPEVYFYSLNNKAMAQIQPEDLGAALITSDRLVAEIKKAPNAYEKGYAFDTAGFIRYKAEHYEKSLGLLKEAEEDQKIWHGNEDDPDSCYHLGLLYYKKDCLQQSAEYYKRAIDARDNFPEAHNDLGVCYLKKGENENAIVEFRNAIEDDPTLSIAGFNLAKAVSHDYTNLNFWNFWSSTTGKKTAAYSLIGLIILSSFFLILFPNILSVFTSNDAQPSDTVIENKLTNVTKGQSIVTTNITKSASTNGEPRTGIEETFLVFIGLLLLALLLPVIRTAKIGPLELSLIEANRAVSPSKDT